MVSVHEMVGPQDQCSLMVTLPAHLSLTHLEVREAFVDVGAVADTGDARAIGVTYCGHASALAQLQLSLCCVSPRIFSLAVVAVQSDVTLLCSE